MKHLIILRPQPNRNGTERLGLYKSEDTVTRQQGEAVSGLQIELDEETITADQQMLGQYNQFGSFIGGQIDKWIKTKQYANRESLLFEWYNEKGTDYYHFVGSVKEIQELIETAERKKRVRE